MLIRRGTTQSGGLALPGLLAFALIAGLFLLLPHSSAGAVKETPAKQLVEVERCVEKKIYPRIQDFYEAVTNRKVSTWDPNGRPPPPAWIKRRVLLFGDMDGGFARTVLSAMRANLVTVGRSHLNRLCRMLVLEAESIRGVKGLDLQKYQSSKSVESSQTRILNSIRYSNVEPGTVVWLGDIVFDRLTNNLPVMDRLLRELHGHGALFIRGNHEQYRWPQPTGENSCAGQSSAIYWGCFARSRAVYTTAQFDQLLAAVFINARYDATNKMLLTHNGVETSASEPGVLKTAFGDLPGYLEKTPEQIAEWIRGRTVDPLVYDRLFSSFRPSDAAMEFTVLMDGDTRITQAHGHNACFSMINTWVFALNPRSGPLCGTYIASAWKFAPAPVPAS